MTDGPCEHRADAAGWVLGALSAEEAERFAAHLQNCESCPAEVARLTEACQQLSDAAAPLPPPPELRDRVMASVQAEASLSHAARTNRAPPGPVGRFGRSRLRAGMLVAALATLAAVITAIVLIGTDHGSRQAEPRTVAGKITPAGGARARAVVQIRAHAATLVVTRLAAPPHGRVYQAWVIRRGLPAAPTGALFSVPRSGDTRILLPPLHDITEVIVTAEPPRGSPTPTLPPIILVQLTAHPGLTALKS